MTTKNFDTEPHLDRNRSMALVLNEEQSMLRDSARGLISDKAPVAHLRQLRDAKDATGFSRELWRAFAEMGFSGLLIPEDFGGSGLGCVEAGVVMEEIGRTLMPSPFLSTAVLAASALSRGGSAAQKSEHLPKIADGSLLAALAIDEGAKHRPLRTRMAAVRAGNGFRLSGAKAFVVDGHTADLLIVAARTAGTAGERDGLTLFLVDPKSKGIETERTAMVDSHNAARIVFSDAEVNADGVLGEVDHGGTLLEGVLNIGRGAVASEMVGLSEEVFSRTVGYLKERKQFGKLIGEFQALQHRAAQLYIEIEITRAAVLKALQTLDGNFENAGTAVAVAKARAGSTATLAVQEGVQMHGGMGMTDQFDIGFFMKRARVCQELFGDSNFHADQLARMKNY
jgi:alkylation response protein AidB-like acyl-CoA dehydrogenase